MENSKRMITFREALTEAMVQAMQKDPNIFVYGIDVADHRRIFGSTFGLVEKFGPGRCFSTPLSEDALAGFGLGAAINGLKPIFIHIRIDFVLLAMNQIVNMISTFSYLTGGKLKAPFIIRAIIGRGWGQGMQHSKALHALFAHIPGLKVVLPSTPRDAKGLMISALKDNNPVIFLEHRWLYDIIGEVNPSSEASVPLGKGNILRQGKDVTIVATSWMNIEATKAAEILAKRGISVEIIDPRTIEPLDSELIYMSVKKTGHCIVADYDWINCGFSSEVAARVQENCLQEMKSPVTRIGFAPTPCPTTRTLENLFYPNAVDIIRAVEQKLKLSQTDLSGEEFYSFENKFKGPF